MECCSGYRERCFEGLVLDSVRPCRLGDRNGWPVSLSKLTFSASLQALANADLVELLDSSCKTGRLLRLVSTESLGNGVSRARMCPDSKVTSGLKLIDGIRFCRKSSRGERSVYRDSYTEPLSGRYSELSALDGGGTSIGGVDAWFSYSASCLISLSEPAFKVWVVADRLVSPKLAVPLPSLCLNSFSP